jgi:hypothetical protein
VVPTLRDRLQPQLHRAEPPQHPMAPRRGVEEAVRTVRVTAAREQIGPPSVEAPDQRVGRRQVARVPGQAADLDAEIMESEAYRGERVGPIALNGPGEGERSPLPRIHRQHAKALNDLSRRPISDSPAR